MTKLNEIYKCDVCGNIIEVIHDGVGVLVCCGEKMKLQDENTVDASTEKHIPVVEDSENGIKVKVGSVDHPMTDEHFIEWIEVITKDGSHKKFLKPGEKPEKTFDISLDDILSVREYCNLHGLWKK